MGGRKKSTNNLIQNSIIFGILIAFLSGAITTIIIGFNLKFLLTLFVGIFLGATNTILSDYFNKKAIEKGRAITVVLSGQLRLLAFAALFYFAITKLGYAGALGAGLGFLSSYIGIMIATALRPKSKPVYKKSNEVEYVNDMPRIIFIKDFERVRYHNGKTFVTHKKFNKREDAQNE